MIYFTVMCSHIFFIHSHKHRLHRTSSLVHAEQPHNRMHSHKHTDCTILPPAQSKHSTQQNTFTQTRSVHMHVSVVKHCMCEELAHSLAMQVAAMSPAYVDESAVPEDETVDPAQDCLLQQPFIRDPGKTVQELVNETVGKLGENVRVRRFTRFSLGE